MSRNAFREKGLNCETKWPIAVTYARMSQMRLCVAARDSSRRRACAHMQQRD